MMNSYFITLIEFLFLALSTNFASWNLCSRDAFCPAFCRPLGVCFCFCGLQSTKRFNPRCEPQSNRVGKYRDIFKNQDSVGSQFFPLFTHQWSRVTEHTIRKNSRGLGKCHMPHWSLTGPSTPVLRGFLSGFCTNASWSTNGSFLIFHGKMTKLYTDS